MGHMSISSLEPGVLNPTHIYKSTIHPRHMIIIIIIIIIRII